MCENGLDQQNYFGCEPLLCTKDKKYVKLTLIL